MAELAVQGVAGGVERVIVLLERLLRRVAPAAGGRVGVAIGAVLGDSMLARRADIEAARAVLARREQAGHRLDARRHAIVGRQGAGGQTLAAERGDVLRLVGAAVPRLHVPATGEL